MKIVASLLAPHLTDDPELVAGYLGAANGSASWPARCWAICCCAARCARPAAGCSTPTVRAHRPGHHRRPPSWPRWSAVGVDRLLDLQSLTARSGGAGSMVRLLILGASCCRSWPR